MIFTVDANHVTTVAATASTTPTAITLPTGTASGDLIVMLIREAGTVTNILPPAGGWTRFIELAGFNAYQKIAGSSEANPEILTASSTRNCVVQLIRVEGVNQAAPINAVSNSTGGGGSNWSSPALTTTVDGCILFGGGGVSVGTSDWAAGDQPPSMTLVGQLAGTNCWLGTAFEQLTTAGAESARTPWENQVNAKVTFSFAVAPGNATSIDSVTPNPLRVGDSIGFGIGLGI